MAKVKDFMTPDVVTVAASARLSEAARLMRDSDIGVLPVVEGDTLRGIITDRDIVIRGLAAGTADATVETILTEQVAVLSPEDDVKDAERRMAEHDVRRLPVVEEGKLVGMVSVGDLATTDSDRAGKVMEKTGPTK
jgi:CBS domain-containing protein